MDSVITQKILFEIEQIDELITDSIPVFNLCKIREPDFVEKCGIALILHSFYNGIENILSLIIKNRDLVLPSGIKWHKELFIKAFEKTENRSQIFREEIKNPRPKGRGIEDFSLQYLRMRGNKSPAPPARTAPRGGELNPKRLKLHQLCIIGLFALRPPTAGLAYIRLGHGYAIPTPPPLSNTAFLLFC